MLGAAADANAAVSSDEKASILTVKNIFSHIHQTPSNKINHRIVQS
jgi:hypothetical protein